MKLEKDYCIQSYFGTDYLMPIGQSIGDFKKGLKLNETSSFLVKLLREERNFEEIVGAFTERYEIEANEKEMVCRDLKGITDQLIQAGYVTEGERWEEGGDRKSEFRIGPFQITVDGPENFLHDFLKPFRMDDTDGIKGHQTVVLTGKRQMKHRNGTVLIRNEELLLMDTGERYVFLFPKIREINELHVKKDGEKAVCYYNFCGEENVPELREEIFHAMRFAFLILAERHHVYAVHSASILYRERAWLFSGQSGTGKSTHTALWKKNFGTPFLNGDLNLIGIEEGRPVVYGIPWCGTSETYVKENYLLGGIVFLRQAQYDKADEPEKDEAAVLVMNRMIYPAWTEETLEEAGGFAEKVVETAGIYRLRCTKNDSAAEVMKEKIDQKKGK